MKKAATIESIRDLVKPLGKVKNVYYAENVNMQFSFDSLKKIVEEDLKEELSPGDIFICDSVNKRSRKALLRTNRGWLILYFRLDKETTTVRMLD